MGERPRWVPVGGLLVERDARRDFEGFTAFGVEGVQGRFRDGGGTRVGGAGQAEGAEHLVAHSVVIFVRVIFSSASPRMT